MHTKRLLTFIVLTFCVAGLTFGAAVQEEETAAAEIYPVPRAESVVVETDQTYQYFNTANPLKNFGTQWGSGWHQVVNEWDWYTNYATGERILWRTTGWDYNEDATELTWHVREGVKWNDGEPYTAHDIVFTFNLWMDNPDLGGAASASGVESVEALDDYTVLFSLKEPDYRFHHVLRMWGGGSIVARHVYENEDPNTFTNWPPVETGPYALEGFYEDNGLYVWERDEDYWGTEVMGVEPGPKYVIFRSAPPPDLDLEEFIQGNVDMPLPHIFTIDMIQAAERRWDHTVRAPYMDAVSTGIAGFNAAREPTNNREFRWALQFLVNREKLARIYNLAESTEPTMWPWPDWASLDKWESPEIEEKYGPMLRYDPAEAERRLDQLGFTKGSDGMRRMPNGDKFTLTLVGGAAPDFNYLAGQDFSDELTKIGIDNVFRVFGSGITEQQFYQGEYHVHFDVLDIRTSFPGDPWRFFDSFHSRHVKPLGEVQNSGDRSRVRLRDPEIDAVAEEMGQISPSSPEYQDLVTEALDRWYHLLPSVPAVEKMFIQTFGNRYWKNWPQEGNMYHVPYQWWPSLIFVLFELEPAT